MSTITVIASSSTASGVEPLPPSSANPDLNPQQRAAAEYNGSATNLLITAGAGCGKTKTIIARVIHRVLSGTDTSRILMMTFTNRAAREMTARLKTQIGPLAQHIQTGTFHSFCLRVMGQMPKSFGITGLTIIDGDDQAELMGLVREKVKKKHKSHFEGFPKAEELTKYFSYSRNTCQDIKTYLANQTDYDQKFIALADEIFMEYQKSKDDRGYLDYDDLLERFAVTLGQKPELRKAIATLFDEVLIDEMQDTNPLQFEILKHFAAEGTRLFCVGDPAQSIYAFRGAEFKHVYRFKDIFPNSAILPLSLNYRSHSEILEISNWLLERSPLKYDNLLEAYRGSSGILPTLCDFDSPQDEAGWIAGKIHERHEQGVAFRDMMVLVRTGFDAKPIEAEFIQRRIPYYFIGGTSLTKSAHIRDILALLRIVRNDQDDLAWARFLKLWPRVGDKTVEKVLTRFRECQGTAPVEVLAAIFGANAPLLDPLHQVLETRNHARLCVSAAVQGLSAILQERYDRWDLRSQDLVLLTSVAGRYKDIGEFIDAFTLEPMTSTEVEKAEDNDAVLLITVHSAKGMEADICFVANAKPGTYPHIRSYGNLDTEEEERRILYVALTRARNELYITRSADHRGSFFMQSRSTKGEDYFLEDVPPRLVNREFLGWNRHFHQEQARRSNRGIYGLMDIY